MIRSVYVLVVILSSAMVAPLQVVVAGKPAVSAELTPSAISIKSHIKLGGMLITVTGPHGMVIEHHNNSSMGVKLTALDAYGERLPDGKYNYEIRPIPLVNKGLQAKLAETRQVDKNGRSAYLLRRDGKLPGKLEIESGHFQVVGGKIVIPEPGLRESQIKNNSE